MPEPGLAAIALGSNLPSPWGTPAQALDEALRRLAALGPVEAVSSFWTTAPVGYLDQPDFANAACMLQTTLSPADLMASLLAIEQTMGRTRTIAKGPRVIDLDLLLYDDAILKTAALTLPHPEMHTRAFVLGPLAEIAPGWVHPMLRLTIAELAAKNETSSHTGK